MKGFASIFICILYALCLAFQGNAFADDSSFDKKPIQILILKSQESNFYNQTIRYINGDYQFNIKNIYENPQLDNNKLIISLGIKAAEYSREHFATERKIFAFISSQQSQILGIRPKEVHLFIDQTTQQYLDFANSLFPTKSIAILYQKGYLKSPEELKTKAHLIEVNPKVNIITTTRDAIKNSDILLALPNKNIYNRLSLRGILLTTYKNKTPLISYSPAHVRAGAIAAIYASTKNLAQHLSDVIKQLSNGEKVPTHQFAKYYSTKLNLKVAQSLRLNFNKNSPFLFTNEAKSNE